MFPETDECVASPAYEMGQKACREHNGEPRNAVNPYHPDQLEFYAWNLGWNNELDYI